MPHSFYRLKSVGKSSFVPPMTYQHKDKPSYGMYRHPRWIKMRRVHLEAHPWCENCKAVDYTNIPAAVVDHIEPHRGDKALFFDTSNLQSLCKKCHDIKTGIGR